MHFFLSDFLYKSTCCRYSFELLRLVHTTYAFIKKLIRVMSCNLKTIKLLNCALRGVCSVIRANTVVFFLSITKHAYSNILKNFTTKD